MDGMKRGAQEKQSRVNKRKARDGKGHQVICGHLTKQKGPCSVASEEGDQIERQDVAAAPVNPPQC